VFGEVERTGENAVMEYLKVLFENSLGGTE
jgi:hypothetical protein